MTGPVPVPLTALDPFDLPEWLGEGEVTWSAETGVRAGSRVPGRLTGTGDQDLPCDLLAVDDAYPAPVVDEDARRAAHQSWQHGQVHLVERDGRPTLAVPGTGFDADRVLDAVGRLALAVGASPENFAARLRIGTDGRAGRG